LEARWSEAEDYYFGTVVPAEHFDRVLDVAPLEQSETPA
jgi:hypothetical protein